jgi:hypothetical protein
MNTKNSRKRAKGLTHKIPATVGGAAVALLLVV